MVGGPVFWVATITTLAGLLVCLLVGSGRAWIGLGLLLMWAAFSIVNAIRVRRLHSIISAPVYLGAAYLMGLTAMGLIDVQTWMIWALGGGMLAANLGERFFGKYL